jgi:hypothetical protein
MEETGTLEKTNSLDSLLPDGEPGPELLEKLELTPPEQSVVDQVLPGPSG